MTILSRNYNIHSGITTLLGLIYTAGIMWRKLDCKNTSNRNVRMVSFCQWAAKSMKEGVQNICRRGHFPLHRTMLKKVGLNVANCSIYSRWHYIHACTRWGVISGTLAQNSKTLNSVPFFGQEIATNHELMLHAVLLNLPAQLGDFTDSLGWIGSARYWYGSQTVA